MPIEAPTMATRDSSDCVVFALEVEELMRLPRDDVNRLYHGNHGMIVCPEREGGWIVIDSSATRAFLLREGEQRRGDDPSKEQLWTLEHGRISFNVCECRGGVTGIALTLAYRGMCSGRWAHAPHWLIGRTSTGGHDQ